MHTRPGNLGTERGEGLDEDSGLDGPAELVNAVLSEIAARS